MLSLKSAMIAIALMLAAAPACAASDSPVGVWKTIDDHTGKPTALIQITETDGALQGRIIKILQSDKGPHPICTKCDGKRKNQPVEGMTILWGLHKNGHTWNGGHILDPDKGSTYKCNLHTIDNGQKLKVRGYIGFSLLGRTQTWIRQQPANAAGSAQPPATAASSDGIGK